MREVMKHYPNDLDAAVLFADAAMELHAWMLWKRDGTPEEGTLEAVQTLESVLKRDPDNIGANHFYIHVMEESPHPEMAMTSAQKMADLAPARVTWFTCRLTSTFEPAIIMLRRSRINRPWAPTRGTSKSITSKPCIR